MKCNRCFKPLPESEWHDWDIGARGLEARRQLRRHAWYTCLACEKSYCAGCWARRRCDDAAELDPGGERAL
ncbi:MAG TPA: hypothetical protein VNN77_12205 [candidate division Zixibacteria bacterium]|nr:hypothetical protein [candidate division Zixibacteria bacterium]